MLDIAKVITAAALSKPDAANIRSLVNSLREYGDRFGLLKPHRLAHFLAQIMHESGDMRFDKEIWGPTPAQKKYDTRVDLGNTPEVDGDGKKYMGRTVMQLTGKSNYAAFYDWCKGAGMSPPDFVSSPDLVNTDPWEGLVPIWYWTTRNLNKWADQGDIETITKKINGGKNGFDDRCKRYARVSLVLLGYKANALEAFQAARGLDVDDDPGPKTRSALHGELVALIPGEMQKKTVTVAPVVEQTRVPVAVAPPALEKPWYLSKEFLAPALTATGLGGITGGLKDFGSIPTLNLVVLIVAAFAILGAVLLYRRSRDRRSVQAQSALIEGR